MSAKAGIQLAAVEQLFAALDSHNSHVMAGLDPAILYRMSPAALGLSCLTMEGTRVATAIAMRSEEGGRVKPGHDDWLEMRDEMCACEKRLSPE
ncbi:MAG: hypothetical protein M3N38_11145 [Pseudomonadota bacterium]|nr:hypothetical protein [Pseudomonadota bacterium]